MTEQKKKKPPQMYEYTVSSGYTTHKIRCNHMDLVNDMLKFYMIDENWCSDLIACFKDWYAVTRKEFNETDRRGVPTRRGHRPAS